MHRSNAVGTQLDQLYGLLDLLRQLPARGPNGGTQDIYGPKILYIGIAQIKLIPLTATLNASAITLSFCSTSSGIVKQLSYGQATSTVPMIGKKSLIRWWSVI